MLPKTIDGAFQLLEIGQCNKLREKELLLKERYSKYKEEVDILLRQFEEKLYFALADQGENFVVIPFEALNFPKKGVVMNEIYEIINISIDIFNKRYDQVYEAGSERSTDGVALATFGTYLPRFLTKNGKII